MAQGVLPKDANYIAAVGGVSSATDTGASIRPFQYDPTTRGLTVHVVGDDLNIGGMVGAAYDYVSMALSNGNKTETYTFKSGGASGTVVATIAVVYTDSTRDVLSSVTKT